MCVIMFGNLVYYVWKPSILYYVYQIMFGNLVYALVKLIDSWKVV